MLEQEPSQHIKKLLLSPLLVVLLSILSLALTAYVVVATVNAVKSGEKLGIDIKRGQEPEHTIQMTGEGKVVGIPDVAVLQFSVQTEGKTVVNVQEDNTRKMNEAIDFLKNMDIGKKDIKTVSYSLRPNYIWDNITRRQKLDGYILTNSVQVKIRDLAMVGAVLAGVTDKGVNLVGNVSFTIDDPESLKQEAREKALVEAKKKAEALADVAGVKLGKVISFYEETGGYPMPLYEQSLSKMELSAAGEVPQVEPGSKEITVWVTVGFEIE